MSDDHEFYTIHADTLDEARAKFEQQYEGTGSVVEVFGEGPFTFEVTVDELG